MTDYFKAQIEQVLEGEIDTCTSDTLISPDVAVAYLKSLGLEEGDMNTNGWQWDFWIPFNTTNKKYYLCGSGYYNRGLTFAVNTDEDEEE